MFVIFLLVISGGSSHSMDGTNHALLGEVSNGLDAVATPPVLRNNFHPRRTNHDRCYVGVCGSCPHSHSKRWSDPHGMEQSPQPDSYYSLPKNLHPRACKRSDLGANDTSQMEDHKDDSVVVEEDVDEELVPCITVVGAH